MNNLYKKFTSKTGFFLFITLISLVGIYFFLSKEGMQGETDYYINSKGLQIPITKNKICINKFNGERICDKDIKDDPTKSQDDPTKSQNDKKPDEYNKLNSKDRPFIPPQSNSENSSNDPVPANCPSLILLEGPVYVVPSSIFKKI